MQAMACRRFRWPPSCTLHHSEHGACSDFQVPSMCRPRFDWKFNDDESRQNSLSSLSIDIFQNLHCSGSAARVPESLFWADYAAHLAADAGRPFLSHHIYYAGHTFTDAVAALAVAGVHPRCCLANQRLNVVQG